MNMPAPVSPATRYYSAFELAVRARCSVDDVARYRRRGLIRPARRGRRCYDRAARRRLRVIAALERAGVPLDDIARLFPLADASAPAGPIAAELSARLARIAATPAIRMARRGRIRLRVLDAHDQLSACSYCKRELARCVECAESGLIDPLAALLLANV